MLTREELADLYGRLRDRNVLSVYINGDQNDPADRRIWATAVERDLDEERARVDEVMPEAVEEFDAARRLVADELGRFGAFLPAPGWVGFATADELHHGDGVAVPMPTLVRFERGIRVAPYVRALKHERPVVAAVADSRRARIFRYHDGVLEEVIDMVADRDFGDLADSVSSSRGGRFTGARGAPGTDTARRLLDISAARLQAEVLDELERLAGDDGLVVFGGTSEVEAALARQADRFGDRWTVRAPMHLTMTEAEARTEIEVAASEISRRLQAGLLDEVVDAARAGGKGCLGVRATKKALMAGQVDTLLMGRAFRERDPDLADRFVGSAFDRGSAVEELSADEAERLDVEGEGVGGRLRFTV